MLCLHKGSLPFLQDKLGGKKPTQLVIIIAGRKFNLYYSEQAKLVVSTLFLTF